MDAARWPQDVKMAKSMEEMSSNTCSRPILERKARPQEQLNCPRCNSTNTKFCYYNNYSLTQPRYFCKTCRRYWTEGGSLRNVPVGGGSRKNKRSLSSSSSSSSASSSALTSKLPDLNPPSIALFPSQSANNLEGQDLNLAIPATIHETQALELLRTGIASRGLNSYIPTPMPDTNALYSSVYPIQEHKPTLGFAVEGLEVGNRYGGSGGRILFPLAELKNMSTAAHDDHEVDRSKGQETTNTNTTTSNGFWSGMFGGGGGPW